MGTLDSFMDGSMGVIYAIIPDNLEDIINDLVNKQGRDRSELIKSLHEKGLRRDEEDRRTKDLRKEPRELKKKQARRLEQINEKFDELDKNVTMISKYF
ncbi:MAG: hypothetical protein ACE5GD_07710 [Candidatus Geothermarchaeales archaeon]